MFLALCHQSAQEQGRRGLSLLGDVQKAWLLGKSQDRWENIVRNEEGRVMRILTATVGTVRLITSEKNGEKQHL